MNNNARSLRKSFDLSFARKGGQHENSANITFNRQIAFEELPNDNIDSEYNEILSSESSNDEEDGDNFQYSPELSTDVQSTEESNASSIQNDLNGASDCVCGQLDCSLCEKRMFNDLIVSHESCKCTCGHCKCITTDEIPSKGKLTDRMEYCKNRKEIKQKEIFSLVDCSDDDEYEANLDLRLPERLDDGQVSGKGFDGSSRIFSGEGFENVIQSSSQNTEEEVIYERANSDNDSLPYADKPHISESGEYHNNEVGGRRAHLEEDIVTSISEKPELKILYSTEVNSELKTLHLAERNSEMINTQSTENKSEISIEQSVEKNQEMKTMRSTEKGKGIGNKTIDDLDSSEIMLTKVNKFDSPSCSEIKMYEHYIISVIGENLQKIDRQTFHTIKSKKMPNIIRMCKIHSHSVGIIRINKSISIVKCETLETMYSILIKKNYQGLCHLDTFVNTSEYLPDPHYVFAVVYTDTSKGSTEGKIDVLKAKPGVLPKRILEYENKVISIQLPNNDRRGISAIQALNAKRVIVGFSRDVECIGFEMNYSKTHIIWTLSLEKVVTDICCSKKFVFLCIKDGHRLALHSSDNGDEISRNILPSDTKMTPDRVSIHKDSIVVKEFCYDSWKNVSVDCKIFKFSHLQQNI